MDTPSATYRNGFKIKTLPRDMSRHELGFAIDCNVIAPAFYLVHSDMGLEPIVDEATSKSVHEKVGEQIPTGIILAMFWLRNNGVETPPKRLYIRTDYECRHGPYGAVNSFDFDAEKKRYVLSHTQGILQTTLDNM
jgi:hypothetical protein